MSDVSQRKPISAVLLYFSFLTSPLFGKPVALLDGNHSGNILLRKNVRHLGGITIRRLFTAVLVISALFAGAKVHIGSIISRSGMVTPNAELTNLVAATASDVVQVVL